MKEHALPSRKTRDPGHPRESTIWDGLIFGIAFVVLLVSIICLAIDFWRPTAFVALIISLVVLVTMWEIDKMRTCERADNYDENSSYFDD